MTLDQLRPFIAIEVPGCPDPILDSAAKLTVRDFLRRSEAWRETITVDWETVLDLGLTPIASVLRLWDRLLQKEIPFQAPEQIRDHGNAWATPGPNPIAWTMDSANVPRVVPAPTGIDPGRTADRIDVYLVRNVAAADTEFPTIPDAIWDRYEDALRLGTLARLMRIPGRDWTDPQRAGAYGVAYENAVADAKVRAAAGFGRPSRQVRYGGY